jgi:hypothetical protein
MAIHMDTSQWDRASKALTTAAETTIRRDVVQVAMRRAADQARATGRGQGGAAAYGAETIGVRLTATGAEIHAGGGGGKGGQLFYGTEFGAQGRRRTTYVMRTAAGGRAVTRRTTRQFRPFVGRQGYYFFPAVRQALRGIDGRVADALTKAASNGHG